MVWLHFGCLSKAVWLNVTHCADWPLRMAFYNVFLWVLIGDQIVRGPVRLAACLHSDVHESAGGFQRISPGTSSLDASNTTLLNHGPPDTHKQASRRFARFSRPMSRLIHTCGRLGQSSNHLSCASSQSFSARDAGPPGSGATHLTEARIGCSGVC